MVGGHRYHIPFATDLFVQPPKQLAKGDIEPGEGVLDFVAVRPEPMPDSIERRKPEPQEVDSRAVPKIERRDQMLSQAGQILVRERAGLPSIEI